MLCSFNSFEEGEYKNTGGTGLRNVWYEDKNNFYRYYTDFGNGLIFHSALYSEKNNKNSLNSDEYNMIGGKTILRALPLVWLMLNGYMSIVLLIL